MSGTWLHVGTAGCFAACGALAVAAHWPGRRTQVLAAAESARLHVSDVELVPVSPGTGRLEVLEPYGTDWDGLGDVEFHYCPECLRATQQTIQDDGALRCSDCGFTQGEA
ncbi:hypothetical protein ACFV4X_26250 [Streptomyces ardesiacus]|uniref:hypothetical protein n=1 Tax=Streptomyces ardesiacus TaxID=285564 RepID=UPI003668532D